jgi:ATP-binding cassette subfamily B protein/subfamily B ATP-binding cassette protein MsbA
MGDTEQVVGGIQNAILNPFNATLRIAGVLIVLIATDWRLSLGVAILVPPVVGMHYIMFRRLRPMWRNIQDDRSLLSGRLTDMFGGIRVVRSFRRERSEHKEFGASQDLMIRKQQFTAILGRLLQTGWGVFVPGIGVVVVWYGGMRVLAGIRSGDPHALTIGDLIMFQTFIFMLLGPITQLIDSMQNLQQNLGALDRVIDVLDQPADMPDKPDARRTENVHGELALDHVTFGYSREKLVLHDINLQIPAGTTLAIVGPSGSGKTTLVNLVARFFDVTEGHIRLDGTDIREYRLEEYRRLFAMVLQDVYLFDGTVMDNIAYGRRGATREEIIEAARKANAHDFILELENAYETIVGERGSKLSGGQKQRISIARAILADPRILVLDEATSSLDSKSEHLIQDSLRELMQDRTTLVIAHRLSTIMHADCIVVLVDGQVVEAGTHDGLIEKRGTYHLMFTQQFERHRDPNLERIEWETVSEK